MATLAKLLVTLGLDAKAYHEGLTKATDSTSSFVGKIGGTIGTGLKVGLVALGGGVAAAIAGIFQGVTSNAEFERFNTQFGVLLGSAEKAQARLDELSKF